MSKYKKIFSGLGLLSISTLIGACVVACANKKPKASDSSTEGIDQNNNQENSSKPKDGENTPGNPTPEAPKTNPETSEEPKTETPKNPEMSKENPEQNDNTGQGNGSNSNKQEENKPTPEPKPKPEPKVTVEAKSMELLESIEKLPYPQKDAKAKQTLKSKVNEIKNKNEEENKKIEELVLLGKEIEQVNNKLVEVIKNIDELPYPNQPALKKGAEISAKDKFKEKLNNLTNIKDIENVLPSNWKNNITMYNEVFKLIKDLIKEGKRTNLIKRFIQTDNSSTGNFTEAELIWQIYETVRIEILPKNNTVEKLNNKQKHGKNVKWLLDNIKKLKEVFNSEKKKPENDTNMEKKNN